MFFVINKEKLTAYAVSVATVIMLFVMAGVLRPKEEATETSANVKFTNTEVINSLNTNANKAKNNE